MNYKLLPALRPNQETPMPMFHISLSRTLTQAATVEIDAVNRDAAGLQAARLMSKAAGKDFIWTTDEVGEAVIEDIVEMPADARAEAEA